MIVPVNSSLENVQCFNMFARRRNLLERQHSHRNTCNA